jgi:hypothetical protein
MKEAGWGVVEASRLRREVITLGRLQGAGVRAAQDIADYVLTYRNHKLAVIEAKRRDLPDTEGVAQAKKYAGKLQTRFAYSTNGAGIHQVDMTTGAEQYVTQYPSPLPRITPALAQRQMRLRCRPAYPCRARLPPRPSVAAPASAYARNGPCHARGNSGSACAAASRAMRRSVGAAATERVSQRRPSPARPWRTSSRPTIQAFSASARRRSTARRAGPNLASRSGLPKIAAMQGAKAAGSAARRRYAPSARDRTNSSGARVGTNANGPCSARRTK